MTRSRVTYLANTIGNPLQGAIFERVLKLPRPLTRKVNVTKNIRVPMPDGVDLVADLYEPVDPREARPDVLVYSSEPLVAPFEVIGPVSATIKVRTSVPFGDVFVRLCDVDENGVSIDVCDGIQRLDTLPAPDEDGVREVNVGMWPTGYRFGPGHRLRVQVCGGSFPHFARNTGSGEPLGEATTLVPVELEILAGSSLTLSATPIDGDGG